MNWYVVSAWTNQLISTHVSLRTVLLHLCELLCSASAVAGSLFTRWGAGNLTIIALWLSQRIFFGLSCPEILVAGCMFCILFTFRYVHTPLALRWASVCLPLIFGSDMSLFHAEGEAIAPTTIQYSHYM